MAKRKRYKIREKLTKTEELTFRTEIPENYHCTCNYCRDNFLGELWDEKQNMYYSQTSRYHYYPKIKSSKHLCPGHWPGYRFAIQKLTNPGDWVLDPMAGTGTAVVESINNGRNAVGIELEFPEIAKQNLQHQHDNNEEGIELGKHFMFSGNVKDLDSFMEEVGNVKFDLIINGTPYPVLGNSSSSDAPERKVLLEDKEEKKINDRTFDYQKEDNFGLLKPPRYYDVMTQTYINCCKYLKVGGKFVIIIKDPVSNKKPYLLHKYLIDHLLDKEPSLRPYGSFIHSHHPPTLFMSTYQKRYPEVKTIPLYQTAIVLEKFK